MKQSWLWNYAKNEFSYLLTHKGSRQKLLEESYRLFTENEEAVTVERICAEMQKVYVNHVGKRV